MGYTEWDEGNDDACDEGQEVEVSPLTARITRIRELVKVNELVKARTGKDMVWKDHSSGAMLGYGTCDENDEDRSGDVVEWEDPTSGAALGYVACDENDVQILQQMGIMPEEPVTINDAESDDTVTGHEEEMEWKDLTSGASLGYAACDENDVQILQEMGLEADDPVTINDSESDGIVSEDDSGHEEGMEWKDLSTGSLLGYAACDEHDVDILHDMGLEAPDALADDDQNAMFEDESRADADIHTIEWADQTSGVMMGYAALDDDDNEITKHFGDDESVPQSNDEANSTKEDEPVP